MHALRVYADTSVFGGPFDDEFRKASTLFFEQVKWGRFELVSSVVVQDEIEPAPQEVQDIFNNLSPEMVGITQEALELQQAYLDANILTPKCAADALHVALATVSKCSAIVSWNFRHIVHFGKIPLYNAVNMVNGYPAIAIYSPLEVIDYDEEKEI